MSDELNTSADAGMGTTPATPEAPVEAPPTADTPKEAALARLGATEPYWGVDTSYDTVTLEEAQRLYAAGIRVAFQCIWTGIERPAAAIGNIKSYHDAGIYTAGYLSVSRGRTGLQHVIEGYDNLPEDTRRYLRDVSVDVELQGLSFETHVAQAVNALQAKGYRPLIYTSYNAWVNYMGNPAVPQGWLLWNAFWDNDPDYDFYRLPYGGGGFVLIGEQFTGGQNVEGVFADRDLFSSEFFVAPVPEPVPEPPVLGSLRDVAFICHYISVALAQGMPVALSPLDKATLQDYVEAL